MLLVLWILSNIESQVILQLKPNKTSYKLQNLVFLNVTQGTLLMVDHPVCFKLFKVVLTQTITY